MRTSALRAARPQVGSAGSSMLSSESEESEDESASGVVVQEVRYVFSSPVVVHKHADDSSQ